MLGCNNDTTACSNPGGVGPDRSGRGSPPGATGGAVAVGTQNGDSAIVERGAEHGAVLLKNDGDGLPVTKADSLGRAWR